MDQPPCRLAVVISGRGSNMLAIARACQDGQLNAQIVLVISNRPEAPGIAAATQLGLPVQVVDHSKYPSRQDFDDALDAALKTVSPDWIVLAGFMRILGKEFIQQWQGRIVNIHPSLLPKYPGLDTHARAIAAGDSHAGASVHIVTAELDAGPIVAQVSVPILPTDTVETLSQRVLENEHDLYIKALKQCMCAEN